MGSKRPTPPPKETEEQKRKRQSATSPPPPPKSITPKCPQCKGGTKIQKLAGEMFRCGSCGGLFDNDPDEGGDYGKYPDQRLMREERAKQRRLGRPY